MGLGLLWWFCRCAARQLFGLYGGGRERHRLLSQHRIKTGDASGTPSSVAWFVAKRYVQGPKRRQLSPVSSTALVAVLGVALGVASLIAVTAVMSGYQSDIQSKILATNAHLVVQKYGVDFTEHEGILEKAEKVEGIVAGAPFVFNEAMLSTLDRDVGVLIKGIDPKRAPQITEIGRQLCLPDAHGGCAAVAAQSSELPGSPEPLAEWLKPKDGVPSVVVGWGLFRRLGQPLGAHIVLTTPVGMVGARGNAPKTHGVSFGRRFSFRDARV